MEIKMHIIYEKVDNLVQASVAEIPGAISWAIPSKKRGEILMKL